ncbi:MAG TPA: SMI1/KNR4 family protein [Gemmata sp.]
MRSGATAEDVSTVERLIGARLPASIRFAYMRHNGEEHNSFGLFGGKRWLPLLQVVEIWQNWQRQFANNRTEQRGRKKSSRSSPQIPPWDSLRIPFSYDWGRGYHCVDLQPRGGVPGRIVMFEFASEEVIAASFEEWLAITFADLASGKWEFGKYGGLVPG